MTLYIKVIIELDGNKYNLVVGSLFVKESELDKLTDESAAQWLLDVGESARKQCHGEKVLASEYISEKEALKIIGHQGKTN